MGRRRSPPKSLQTRRPRSRYRDVRRGGAGSDGGRCVPDDGRRDIGVRFDRGGAGFDVGGNVHVSNVCRLGVSVERRGTRLDVNRGRVDVVDGDNLGRGHLNGRGARLNADVDREDALLLELNVYIEGGCAGFDFGVYVVERLLYVDLLGRQHRRSGRRLRLRRWSL